MGPIPELTITSPYVDPNAFTMGNPMPESTLTLCQSRLYPPVRDFGFCLGCALSEVVCNIYSPSKLPPQISLLLIKFYTKFPN
jgi:hypothetical protein